MTPLAPSYYKYLALLKLGPFQQRGGRWRFGTRRIGDSVVDRLVDAGRASIVGGQLIICQRTDGER